MIKFRDYILNLIFPPRCVVCTELAERTDDSGKKYLCKSCFENMPYIKSSYRCEKCGMPMDKAGICPLCTERKQYFDKCISAFEYNDIKNSIEDFKFKGNKYLSEGLGYIMYRYAEEFYPDLIEKSDIICFVPMFKDKLKERGFDHSALLAEGLAERSGKEYGDCIIRVRGTTPQSKLKSYADRAENVKNAFSLTETADVRGKRILLTDDIFTTGSSVSECARILYKGGAKSVTVYTLSASYKEF